jgi:GNAT superfamily N-acetyltransferase
MVEVIKVQSKKELKKFIDFPHTLYKGDKNYVPELYVSQKDIFSKKKYPFFKHSKADLFLAIKNNKVAGRIVAIRNNNYIKFSGENIGFFGFFESINDYQVTESLFNKVVEWIKEEGLEAVVGPENYTVNDSCGILTEGFNLPPVVGMPYNKQYYPDFFERYGFVKKIDMVAYHFSSNKTPETLIRHESIAEEIIKKSGVKIRPIDMKNIGSEIKKFQNAYNSAFEKNWGFVPLTYEEFRHQAKNLKKIADPDMVLLAEHNGDIIGFVCTLPDINQVMIKIRKGRLFPFGLLRFLYYKNKINGCRISIMGTTEKYRKMGIGALLYAKVFEMARRKNINWAEASYVMEDNKIMNSNMQNIGGRIYKKYRIYEFEVLELKF